MAQTFDECRICLLDNGEVLDYMIDRSGKMDRPKRGNIYKGRVEKILPGMQVAFMDIGHKKAGFLHRDDALVYENREGNKNKKKSIEGCGKTDKKLLQSILKKGDEVMVQVVREAIADKGPRVSRQISLAGRYMVLMPFMNNVGISSKIIEEEERIRLKSILESIKNKNTGVIARTAAKGLSEKILKEDLIQLNAIWDKVEKRNIQTKSVNLIYQDLSFIEQILRDVMDEDVKEIVVDHKKNLKEVQSFISGFLPTIKAKVRLHRGKRPLFDFYNVDKKVQRGLSGKISLKSGGYLCVDQTEALVSIDVNTGRFTGTKNFEDTIVKTNLEAVKEIAWLLRLRNCGGIVVIDFIDMEKESNRISVYTLLLEELKKDRAKTNVRPISSLGLVEMTRKRTHDTLTRILCGPCLSCDGSGWVKSEETVSYELIRQVIRELKKNREAGGDIVIHAHPRVVAWLKEKKNIISSLEEEYGRTFNIHSKNHHSMELYDIRL